jgi:hypothetical protein
MNGGTNDGGNKNDIIVISDSSAPVLANVDKSLSRLGLSVYGTVEYKSCDWRIADTMNFATSPRSNAKGYGGGRTNEQLAFMPNYWLICILFCTVILARLSGCGSKLNVERAIDIKRVSRKEHTNVRVHSAIS